MAATILLVKIYVYRRLCAIVIQGHFVTSQERFDWPKASWIA